MIIFFGPAGAGKSVQGQILAARHGWRWLSAGQLLRDTRDPELLKRMATGALVDPAVVNGVVQVALEKAKDIDHIIMDGYPREMPQAEWLIGALPQHNRSIKLVVVLEVPKNELIRRLHIRGRADDSAEAIEERLQIYHEEVYPVLTYLTKERIHIAHIDGSGTVGQVHDRIESELEACSLV